MTVDKESLQKRVKAMQNVPTLPDVFDRISQLVEDPETSVEDIANVIGSDQALSAKILRVVNSALHGFPGRISSITHALIILGIDVVQGLVLSTSVFDMMIGKGLQGMWAHSLGSAIAAGVISRKLKYAAPEEVSIAALLHDIGKVIFKTEVPDEAATVDALVKSKDISIYEAEEKVFGLTHTSVGRWLCEEWNLPTKLTDPIAYHHKPTMSQVVEVPTFIVHLADVMVRAAGFGFGGDDLVPKVHPDTWEVLNIDDALLDEIIGEAHFQLEDSKGLIADNA
jgi:putative nucleotidyltransferase with HDIG domain